MRCQSCGDEAGKTALLSHFAALFRDFDARHCECARLFDFKTALLRHFTALLHRFAYMFGHSTALLRRLFTCLAAKQRCFVVVQQF